MPYSENFCEICGIELHGDDYCRIVCCGKIRKVLCPTHFGECVAIIEKWHEEKKQTEHTSSTGLSES